MNTIEENKVIEILGASEPMSLNLDDKAVVRYWGRAVLMANEKESFESIVTFETKDRADSLKTGDVFLR